MSNILETKNINKYFEQPVRFHVLKDISIQLARGECFYKKFPTQAPQSPKGEVCPLLK